MSKHGPRHRSFAPDGKGWPQPPPTLVPAPPAPLYPNAREQRWLFAIVVIASAAAVIAIFSAGYVTGIASVAR